MVVDDNGFAGDIIKQSVEKFGFDTLSAEDGVSGLALVKRTLPDIVFADIEMPGMDGLEMTEALAKSPGTSHIPAKSLIR